MSSTSAINAPITISGLSSGIDTNSIIQQLGQAEAGAETVETNKQTTLNAQLTEWQNFNTSLLSLQTQSLGLSTVAAFAGANVTSSDTTVASATAIPGAVAGNHNLSVTTLAQAQQVLSHAQSDPTAALNLAGSFSINGHQVTIAATNSLNDIVTAINGAGAGVSASVLTISPGNSKLSLAATASGTVNAISATDLGTGTVLQSLGIIAAGPATAVRQSISVASGTGAGSMPVQGSSVDFGSLMGATTGAAPAGTVQINGVNVALDLNTMSLNDVASAINTAGVPNVTAQVVSVPDANGNITPLSKQQLQLTSSTGAITSSSFTDSNGVLAALGVVQSSYGTQVTAAQDATFSVDNVQFTRSNNSISDVIPDVTFNLLSHGATATTTLSISQDTSDVVNAVQSLVSAYNSVNDYINTQNTFTPPASTTDGTADDSPPLFGDFTLITIQQQLAATLTASFGGQSLQSIGVTTGSTGDLTVDTGALTTALQNNPTAVYDLFGATGSATNSSIAFVSATTNTASSPGAGYAVNITQPATQAVVESGTPQTSPTTAAETMTFGGTLFGGSSFNLVIPSGSTQQNIVDLLNGNSNVNQRLFASIDSATGDLKIASKGFGSNSSFTLASNVAASASSSGLGTTTLNATGQDVAGTINGEAATGVGQTLSGNTGNLTTDGLVLNVGATAPGIFGTVSVSHGLADQINSLVNNLTNSTTGDVQTAETAINNQLTDVGTQITQMQTEVAAYTAQLTTEFANMETALSTLKTQSAAFNAEIGAIASTTSAGTTSASSGSSSATKTA